MPASAREITPADLIPDAEYAKQRRERRQALLPVKRLQPEACAAGLVCTVDHFRKLRHHALPGAGDAADRKGRRGPGP